MRLNESLSILQVTCFATNPEGTVLVSGSKDSTLCIWKFKIKGKARKLDKDHKLILRGHDDEVTCAQLSVDLDVCVSGSKDGTVIVHTLINGRYVRTIDHPDKHPIHKLVLSNQGLIVVYSDQDKVLHLFGIFA